MTVCVLVEFSDRLLLLTLGFVMAGKFRPLTRPILHGDRRLLLSAETRGDSRFHLCNGLGGMNSSQVCDLPMLAILLYSMRSE